MCCGKPVTARVSRFSPRFEIFELKADENVGIRQVVDYSIKSKGYFGKDKSKEESLVSLVIFEGRILGMNTTAHQIRICGGALEG
jgi:hypothetical protein